MERTDPEEVNDKINKMLFIYSGGRWQTSLSWRWSRWHSEQHFTDAVNGAVYVLELWVLLLLGGGDSRAAQWLLTKFCPNTDT